VSTIVRVHQKTWRAARVMALESGAAPRAPMWHPAPRAAACSRSLWRHCLCYPAPGRTGVAVVLRPVCGQQGARPAARRGVGEASGSAGDSRVQGGAGGPTGKRGFMFPILSWGRLLVRGVHCPLTTARPKCSQRDGQEHGTQMPLELRRQGIDVQTLDYAFEPCTRDSRNGNSWRT
jgi:hypothetical protein